MSDQWMFKNIYQEKKNEILQLEWDLNPYNWLILFCIIFQKTADGWIQNPW